MIRVKDEIKARYRSEKGPLFFISAGDPSGDIYGSSLVEELKSRYPESSYIGLGGYRMRKAGVHLLADPERIALVGFTEVVRDLPYLHGLLRESESIFRDLHPELVILIDYPGFNLRLARRAKRRGRKTLFYVSPQVWAWRKGRCRNLIRDSDEIAVILPFEVEFFHGLGKEVHYVGHPIIEEISAREPLEAFRKRYHISPDLPVLGLSPGSRRSEIDYHLPVLLEIARLIRESIPEIQVLINRSPTISARELQDRYLREHDDIRVIHDSHHTSIEATSLLLTKSGTTTLEAALLLRPMIVCYRMSRISYHIARTLIQVPYVSLVNILAGKPVVPEYIQDAFTPDRIFPVALELLKDERARGTMREALRNVVGKMAGGRANERVAKLAVSLIEGEWPIGESSGD